MKYRPLYAFACLVVLLVTLMGCSSASSSTATSRPPAQSTAADRAALQQLVGKKTFSSSASSVMNGNGLSESLRTLHSSLPSSVTLNGQVYSVSDHQVQFNSKLYTLTTYVQTPSVYRVQLIHSVASNTQNDMSMVMQVNEVDIENFQQMDARMILNSNQTVSVTSSGSGLVKYNRNGETYATFTLQDIAISVTVSANNPTPDFSARIPFVLEMANSGSPVLFKGQFDLTFKSAQLHTIETYLYDLNETRTVGKLILNNLNNSFSVYVYDTSGALVLLESSD